MSISIEEKKMNELREALGSCSSETVRLVQPLLSLPAVQHMLLVFLSDQSRFVLVVLYEYRRYSGYRPRHNNGFVLRMCAFLAAQEGEASPCVTP